MKKWEDKDRRDAHFNVQFQPSRGIGRYLTKKYEGTFRVKKRVEEISYELELPNHIILKHPVFHVSQLNICKLDAHHPERKTP